jgi:dihydroorotate dehydrogenase
MYRSIIRPLLFLIDPERIHHLLVFCIKFYFKIPGLLTLVSKIFIVQDPKLQREVFGLKFSNPIGMAAGFDKNAEVFNEMRSFGFSFIEVGTLTPHAQPGNPKPRVFRLVRDAGLINRMGINNFGITAAVKRLKRTKHKIIIGGNIGKNTSTPNSQAAADYESCFKAIYSYVDYIALNVSCPNVESLSDLQEKYLLQEILERLSRLRNNMSVYKPILVKISPDLTNSQIDDSVELMIKFGVDGVIATNTTTGRESISLSEKEIEKMGKGGMSGLPLRDRSTGVIRYIVNKTGGKLPVIGVGGIMSEQDALEKLAAGASLIQVYTGFIYEGPAFVKRLNQAILAKSENI